MTLRLTPQAVRLYGCDFRSTLEAQYAAFFKLAGCVWEYEPPWEQGYSPNGRLPDFQLYPNDDSTKERGVLVEVKPPLPQKTLARVKRTIDNAFPPPPKDYVSDAIWVLGAHKTGW